MGIETERKKVETIQGVNVDELVIKPESKIYIAITPEGIGDGPFFKRWKKGFITNK